MRLHTAWDSIMNKADQTVIITSELFGITFQTVRLSCFIFFTEEFSKLAFISYTFLYFVARQMGKRYVAHPAVHAVLLAMFAGHVCWPRLLPTFVGQVCWPLCYPPLLHSFAGHLCWPPLLATLVGHLS